MADAFAQIYDLNRINAVGDPLRSWDNIQLECMLNKLKPAHTIIIWEVTGPEFDKSFNFEYDSIPSDDLSHIEGSFDRGLSGEGDFDSSFNIAFHKNRRKGFSSAFDIYRGGAFNFKAFSNAFDRASEETI